MAISPQAPDGSLSTVEKNELSSAVLSDAGDRIARQPGILDVATTVSAPSAVTDATSATAARYGITSIPAMVVLRDGGRRRWPWRRHTIVTRA